MSPKTLARLGAVLAALAIATAIAALMTRPPGPKSLATESIAERIDRIEVEHPDGKIELVEEKTGWIASNPKGYPADGRTIEEILTRLPRTRVSEALTEDPERYELFGFGASSATHVKLFAGKTTVLDFYVGKAGTDYPSSFLRFAKETAVVQVLGMAPNDWARAPSDWLDKKIVGGLAEGVTGVSVKGPKASWELEQSSAGWTIGGRPIPTGNVERLVRQVREAAGQLEADGVLEASAAPKDTGLEKPERTVKVRLKTGPVTFYVGKPDGSGRRYVRKEGEARVIFLVADWKLEPLLKPASSFLAKP